MKSSRSRVGLAALVRHRDAQADRGQAETAETKVRLRGAGAGVPGRGSCWWSSRQLRQADPDRRAPGAGPPVTVPDHHRAGSRIWGLSTDLAELRRTGGRPLLLGLLLWITVSGTSLLLQWPGLNPRVESAWPIPTRESDGISG